MDFKETDNFEDICEFIEKIILLSQHLNSLSERQVKSLFGIVEEDLKYKLPKKVQSSLFEMFKNIKKIIRLKTQTNNSVPDVFAYDQKDQQICLKWRLERRGESKGLQDSVLNHGLNIAYIFYVPDGSYEVVNFKDALQRDINDLSSIHEKTIDLNSSIQKYDVKPLTSEIAPIISQSQNLTLREIRIKQVKSELSDKKLCSKKAVADYGEIYYVTFFEELLTNPQKAKNKRWIGFFTDDFSKKWKEEGLVAIRRFFQEFPPNKN